MPNEETAVMTGAQQRSVAAHQPGQDVFKSVLSEDIDWKPFAAFPPSARLAVVVGQPSEPGYTVISGVFYIGLGDQFNPDKLQAYPPGSVLLLPSLVQISFLRFHAMLSLMDG